MVLYSAVSSPLDRSKRFTLSSPGRPVHSDTVLGFSWKHSSQAAIAQRLFTHIYTTVYSQVLIYTAESTEASWSERNCPNVETVTPGIRTRAISIASPAFYQLSYRAPRDLRRSTTPRCPLSGCLSSVVCLVCLKPTNTNSLPVLAGIAPSYIRRAVASRTEQTRQTTDERHIPPGAENPWTTWKALNRLRMQVGRSRVNMLKWGFSNEPETCDCGITQTKLQLLVCPMMDTACSPQDWQRLTTSPSPVPGIGRAQFDWHTTPGGRTRMMMMMDENWFERMSKRKLIYQLISSTVPLILTLVCLGLYFTNTAIEKIVIRPTIT